jgi:hypothetical protein
MLNPVKVFAREPAVAGEVAAGAPKESWKTDWGNARQAASACLVTCNKQV